MFKLRNIFLLLIVLVVAGLIAYRFATYGEAEKLPSIDDVRRTEGMPVDVVVIKQGVFEKWLEMTGQLEGIVQAPIYSNMPVRIRQVLVQQGEQVRAGKPLIVLDSLSASSSYAMRESARLQYENAKREYERLLPLFQAGAISESNLDMAKTAMESAKAMLTDANATLTLNSPVNGIVTEVRIRPGDKVGAGETLAVVAEIKQVRMKLYVSKRDVIRIKAGQPVEVVANGDGGEIITGRVANVSLSADPESRLFLVEAVLDSQGQLLSGTMQRVRIRINRTEDVILAPVQALQTVNGAIQLYVAKEDMTSEKRQVQVGESNDTQVVIASGLQAGEKVVVNGMNLLTGGEKVQIHSTVEY